MKIGIITAHTMINPGAFLQAYALTKTIKNLGYDAEIVDFAQLDFLKKEITSIFYRNKGIKRISEQFAIVKYFFFRHYYFTQSFPILKENASSLKKYQVLFFGSDEIWNYENYFFGFTPIFFAVGISTPKTVSYAPSFGSITSDDELPKVVKEALTKIDYISVRDDNSKAIIEKNLPKTSCTLCLDPTLLYDFDQEISVYKKLNLSNEHPFILVYANSLSGLRQKEILEIAKSQNLKIIVAGMNVSWADKSSVSFNPFYILSLFQSAKFVFTNTFHGCIFCIKYSHNFALEIDQGKKNKINFLINTFSLHKHVVNKGERLPFLPDNTHKSTKHGDIDPLIEKAKQESLKFIINSLS
jgi:hypothetical protein